MNQDRRDLIKFIVAGSIAAGCPVDVALLAAPPRIRPEIDGDHYEICHQVRDAAPFAIPAVSQRHDVLIVGGGVSGLSAAYFLRDMDFLLLEKEEHWGGNAYLDEFAGQAFATGAAFDFKGSESDQLMGELGLKQLPINDPDPSIINGTWVGDTWASGLDHLPYPAAVRESFKKFKRDTLALKISKNPQQFDNEPMSKYTADYAPELKNWWDAYGPSNWGAMTDETSAYVGLSELSEQSEGPHEDDRITLPGGNGAITRKLAEVVGAKHREHMLDGATVIAVHQDKSEVRVTYSHMGKLVTVAAKVAIMASPKFITAHLVADMPAAQRDAISLMRYIPYPVINMIFDKPVYNRGYDTWCPGNTFTDFILADWTVRHEPGYHQKNNILTFYTPLRESERHKLLTVESCRHIAASALRDFQKLLPEFNVDPIEIHMYRRGHPMFMATPGTFTKLIPAASKPMERIFFANTDSVGPESLTSGAVLAARRAADWTKKILAGKSSRKPSPPWA
jgi:monoamine oxidase